MNLMDNITAHTNNYADFLLHEPLIIEHIKYTKRSIFQLWKPTNRDEIWLYLTLSIMMSITKKPEYAMYWTTDHVFATPIFSRLMRRDRYEQIRKMIHFSDRESEDPEDSLAKLREFIDYLLEKFHSNYTPNKNLAIDEYLSLWKGRLSFKIYIPTKRERYGVKIYMLCESATGYIFNFIIYTGATTEYINRIPSIKDFEKSVFTGKYII